MIKSTESGVASIHSTDDLDHLLAKFQAFVNQMSDVEGVVTHPCTNKKKEMVPIKIQPRVFLNILHAVLKGDELNFPPIEEDDRDNRDPYFYDEDYDAVMPVDDDDDNDDIVDGNNDKDKDELPSIKEMIQVMDQELQGHRSMEEEIESMDHPPALNAEESSSVQVLSNLLQSLEASGGESGPVINILKQMESKA
jgi:hypothetical protein